MPGRKGTVRNSIPGNPIHSVEEFLQTFKAGDSFWTIVSNKGKPIGIELTKILEIGHDLKYGCVVKYGQSLNNSLSFMSESFVVDLVNEWHGVCRTKKDAKAYLKYRQQQYQHDPMIWDPWGNMTQGDDDCDCVEAD